MHKTPFKVLKKTNFEIRPRYCTKLQ